MKETALGFFGITLIGLIHLLSVLIPVGIILGGIYFLIFGNIIIKIIVGILFLLFVGFVLGGIDGEI